MIKDLSHARRLIQRCKKLKNPYLDLGNCNITDLRELPELFECEQVETLILSSYWYDENKKLHKSRNNGFPNKLEHLTVNFIKLKNLKILKLCGGLNINDKGLLNSGYWNIWDIDYLKNLPYLQSLDLSFNIINDYSFLEKLSNLESLIVRNSHISELNFLENLEQLHSLDLCNNQISDISYLEKFDQLRSLSLSNNKISEISHLEKLEHLRSLSLNNNRISDISHLKKLVKLQSLNLNKNLISSIDFIKNLIQLRSLNLGSNQISEIGYLGNLHRLHSLEIRDNQISNISCLEKLPQLNSLDLSSNDISDYNSFKKLLQLQSLKLRDNQISNISFFVKLTHLTLLDLGYNQISNITGIEKLLQLQSLNLCNNQISDIKKIEKLQQLNSLNLSFNRISEISFQERFSQLRSLNVRGNKISSIIFQEKLSQLQFFDFRNNQISNISFLEKLPKLHALNLSGYQVSDISFLEKQCQLRSLDLSNNHISNINYLGKLRHLRTLDLSHNRISNINRLEKLRQLQSLDLSYNQISTISFIEKLEQLQSLGLSNNQIEDISFLEKLPQLNSLILHKNQITFVPEFIFKLENWKALVDNIIKDNPISNPPIEKIRQGKNSILSWFAAKKEKFNEIKILLIGEPEAGKTSLLKRLKNDTFLEKEPQTDGINIVDIDFSKAETFKEQTKLYGIKGRFWDFGGQEIMNATHKLFLSSRAIYILVLQARKDINIEKQIRDWVNEISLTGGNSPIIVVANKIDINYSFDFVNTFGLQKEFPQIYGFLKVSCSKPENLDQLKSKLEETIPQAGFFNSTVDIREIELKEKILVETEKEDFIDERRFDMLCEEVGLYNDSKKYAIDFLDKLGVALHFPKIKRSEFYVLDPNWVTTGIYRIITSERASKQKGKINIEDLDFILNKEREKLGKVYHPFSNKEFKYKYKDVRAFLAEVLFQYKLAFPINNDGDIIIPNLLSGNPSKELLEAFEQVKTLDFVYDYGIIPSSIVPQLLVDISSLKEYWRHGCTIEKNNCEALILSNNNRIEIHIKGDEAFHKRNLMIYIQAIMENINEGLAKPPKKLVPIHLKNSIDYVQHELLIRRLNKGKKEFIYHEYLDDEQKFQILELLDGIPKENEVLKMLEELSSSHKELEYYAKKMYKTTVDLKTKLDEHYDFLIKQPSNKEIKEAIIENIEEISDDLKDKIVKELFNVISTAFELHQDDLDDRLKEIFDELQNTSDVKTKLKLSVPLLNYIGINLETEFDVQMWAKKMRKKYELEIFNLFGYV